MNQLLVGAISAVAIAVFSFRMRFLTAGGALCQAALGFVLLGVGGWQWTIPILIFFLSSSILSRIHRHQRSRIESSFSKTSTRDAVQVLANGGVAGLCVLGNYLVPDAGWYVAYAGSTATVTADTWGTEVGTLFGGPPRLITNFRRVAPGRSGGLTVAGTLAGVIGAAAIFLSAFAWLTPDPLALLIPVVLGGVFGTLLDSLLGATIQVQFSCNICGGIVERTEHCGQFAVRVAGFRRMTNDMVNFAAAIFGGGCCYLIRLLAR